MDLHNLKLILFSCALLCAYLGVSHGQMSIPDFSSGSPSTCDSTRYINADDVFQISDVISSEGRNNRAFEERSKGQKIFRSKNSYDDSSFPYKDLSSLGFQTTPPTGAGDKILSRHGFREQDESSFKNDEYSDKMAEMFPHLEDDTYRSPRKKPEDFYNFMANKFTGSYRNEKRKFPEHPTRIGTEPSKKPKKKDMLSGLPGKVEGKKKPRNDSPGPRSHAGHRERHGKLPPFVKHILQSGNEEGGTTPISEPEHLKLGIPVERRPLPPPQQTINDRNSPLMDILGDLGPDKVQRLKHILGTMDEGKKMKGRERFQGRMGGLRGGSSKGRAYGLYEAAASRMGEGRDREEEEEDGVGGGRRYPQTYNLDAYEEKMPFSKISSFEGRDMMRRRHSSMSHERPPSHSWDHDHFDHDRDRDHSPEYPADGEIPDALDDIDGGNRRIRIKRDVFPKYPFEKLAEEKGISRDDSGEEEDDVNEVCKWTFKKGKDCRKMVVKMQYWIDGVRDCKKEYLFIRGGGHENIGDRLCGGQESLRPYIIEGNRVLIEHYRDTNAGPGVTKFKGTIQCE